MSPRRSKSEGTLLDLWSRREEYGAPLGCLATTFTFEGPFFEEECLARFVGMQTDASEDPRSYLIEREELLSHVFAGVLVDRRNVARTRSLRWEQIPVGVPSNGILHAKVSLLAWTNFVRVIVGSPNLTTPGYRKNFEQFGLMELSPENENAAAFEDVIAFLRRVVELIPGGKDEKGPVSRSLDFLKQVRARVSPWPREGRRPGEPALAFLGLVPGSPSLFEQVGGLWRGTGPDEAVVLSPFFDQADRAKTVVDSLLRIMGSNGERTITFHAAGNELPDDALDLNVPAVYRESWNRRVSHQFSVVSSADENGDYRPLHAKSLCFARGDQAAFVVGSSNFTVAGTGVGNPRNIEANLAYVIPPGGQRFLESCVESMPAAEELDLSGRDVRFLTTAEQSPDSEAALPLPRGFGLAIFETNAAGFGLLLHFGCDNRAVIRDEDGCLLLECEERTPEDPDPGVRLAWAKPRPPSYLLVTWRDSTGNDHESPWVVNVREPALLPPPEELRDLSLEVLVEVLTSARPIHETLGAIRERAGNGHSTPNGFEVDPHKRVDTSGFLLKRVQRVSKALEGLRERLERPALHLDSIRWRLEGPVGPVALARQLVNEEGGAAAFLIAETALTLTQVCWKKTSLPEADVLAMVRPVLQQLRELAGSCTAVESVSGYVAKTFKEVAL